MVWLPSNFVHELKVIVNTIDKKKKQRYKNKNLVKLSFGLISVTVKIFCYC